MEGVQDFFNSPTLEKFKNIPSSQRKSLLTEYLKDDLHETSKVAKYFVSISVALKDDKDALMEWAETVLKPALESADCKEEWLISSLLIHMGLLKGEEKMEYPKDISGPLKALDYTVKQPYFPRHLKSFFVAFVSKPNKLLESCSETRHQFLQTLYQI